ncbi:hypothetical protein Tsubulata_043145 [Turnera subulata]|uniref:Uncharacterized protein n=1 Tax=Turnera subulata TaxID=218843 RepID=A0A9Q0FTV7_9ROSI|nr:hypothetical protein Tsubulata_043145 [Turnera subulata]
MHFVRLLLLLSTIMKEEKTMLTEDVDDGSFEELVDNISEQARNPKEKDRLLTERIVEGFLHTFTKRITNRSREIRGDKFSCEADVRKMRFKFQSECNGLGEEEDHEDYIKGSKIRRRRCPGREEKQSRRGKNLIRKFKELGVYPPPDYAAELKSHLGLDGDTDMHLLIMKQIWTADMDSHLDRFSIPGKQILDKGIFVAEEEIRNLGQEGIAVKLIVSHREKGRTDHSPPNINIKGEVYDLMLRNWGVNSKYFVLTSSWNKVVRENMNVLKVEAVVQVYSFWRNRQLWLVLMQIRDADHIENKIENA